MLILVLLGMYFDAVVVFVTSHWLFTQIQQPKNEFHEIFNKSE